MAIAMLVYQRVPSIKKRHVPSPSQAPGPPFASGASAGQDYTSVTFEPDLPRFGMTALEVGKQVEGRSVPVVPQRKW